MKLSTISALIILSALFVLLVALFWTFPILFMAVVIAVIAIVWFMPNPSDVESGENDDAGDAYYK